ncbi:MAG: helix-turn-helix transcriptional regulator [Clostridia bacterium]|nr:helix-turn-helix transcriptional regulator [Clostridia bacterium]
MKNYRAPLALSEHDENVVRYYLPKNDVAADLADFFTVFSDATRVRILSSLAITEMCVTDICLMLGQIQSTVSHQLALLRTLRLVKTRRKGKIVYYSLASPYIERVLDVGVRFLHGQR